MVKIKSERCVNKHIFTRHFENTIVLYYIAYYDFSIVNSILFFFISGHKVLSDYKLTHSSLF